MSFIEDFYFGNLEPQATTSKMNSKMKRQLNNLVKKEETLRSKMNDEMKALFEQYINSYNELLSTCCADSFVVGFKYGSNFAIDVFSEP